MQRGGTKTTLSGLVSGLDIGCYNGGSFHLAFGTYNLQIYDIQTKGISLTVKGSYDSSITAARLCGKNKYLVYACGNDWSKGLDSLVEEKKPKLFAIKFKEH